jgi:hypothetical protein
MFGLGPAYLFPAAQVSDWWSACELAILAQPHGNEYGNRAACGWCHVARRGPTVPPCAFADYRSWRVDQDAAVLRAGPI